jgi:hypothetical protein
MTPGTGMWSILAEYRTRLLEKSATCAAELKAGGHLGLREATTPFHGR